MHSKSEETAYLLEQYKRAVDVSSIVSKTDVHGTITYVNEAFCKASGYTEEELLGASHNIIRHPDNSKILYKSMWDTISSKQIYTGTIKNISKQGRTYYVNTTIIPILNLENEIVEYISVRNDVTELIEHKHLLKEQLTDTLTQLPNRLALVDTLQKSEETLHLIILDIDNFRQLNEVYGYRLGDALLVNFALFVKNLLPEHAQLFRLNADGFAIVLPCTFHLDAMTHLCDILSDEAASNPIIALGERINVSMTFGISAERANLIGSAETAHRHSKLHNYRYTVYSDEIEFIKKYEENIRCIGLLRSAIEHDRLLTYFQPIIDNATQEVYKYEALIRIQDDDGSVLTPDRFLEVARTSKLYHHITDTIFRDVFKALKESDASFSINVTLEDLESPRFMKRVKHELENCSHPERITFELLESENIEDKAAIVPFVELVKTLGAKLAIDDFGTGYSNFKYLASLDVDYIKIDGSIIRHILDDHKAHAIARSITYFARELGIKTIAEYVSSEALYNEVKKLDIDYSQGYYFGEPTGLPRSE